MAVHRDSRLPTLAAAGAALLALVLFFTATVPALSEHRRLQRVEEDRLRLRASLEEALQDQRTRQAALQLDVQAILIEIDELGLTPDELLGDLWSLDVPGAGARSP